MRGVGLWVVDSPRSLTAWGKKLFFILWVVLHSLGLGSEASIPFPRRQQLKQFVVCVAGVLGNSEGLLLRATFCVWTLLQTSPDKRH